MSIDDVPTIAERYAQAIGSKRLVIDSRTRGDADYLIAAGWQGDDLGTLLMRLRTEFDAVRAEVRHGPLNRTEMALVLMRLTTLRDAREAFGSFAVRLATWEKFMRPDAEAMTLAGQVLDAWLDPLCQSCDGRGFTGGSHRGDKKLLCRACSGSGHRRTRIGKDAEQRYFAAALWRAVEVRMDETQKRMRRALVSV